MEIIETERLLLRRPRRSDEPAVFSRYASDPDVTRYMSFPTHQSLDDTRAFIEWCDTLWARWPKAGPLLVFARDGVTLLGGAGIVNDSETVAQIGYILARDVWGRGYATEALLASVEAARAAGVRRLEAGVHVDHQPSCRVGGTWRRHNGIAGRSTSDRGQAALRARGGRTEGRAAWA